MIDKIRHVSFGTNIKELEEKIREARQKNCVKSEHITTLEELKKDRFDTVLAVEQKQGDYVITLRSPTLNTAKQIVQNGRASLFAKQESYEKFFSKLEKEFEGDDMISKMVKETGYPVSKQIVYDSSPTYVFDTNKFLECFEQGKKLPELIKYKEMRVKNALRDYEQEVKKLNKIYEVEDLDMRLKKLFG